MTRAIKVIQLAAYGSNLGDNANIVGLRAMLSANLGGKVAYTDWEMVDYSWGLDTYDQADIDRVNAHDLLIIGGGGFFEIIPETDCWTGSRIAIPYDLFRKIRVPIVFHGVGIDTVRGGGEDGVSRFKDFLDLLFSSDQYLVSTRNDGSLATIRRLCGDAYADRFDVVPDGGFFTRVPDLHHPEIPPGCRGIAVNFGGDLMWERFPEKGLGWRAGGPREIASVIPKDYEAYRPGANAAFETFLDAFTGVLSQAMVRDPDLRLIFVPHIYRDIEVAYALFQKMGFPFSRRSMAMAPYLSGQGGQDYIFDLYRKCSLAIGMRFHANVCPIGLGTPSIGLTTFPMTGDLYGELGIPERALDPNDDDFAPAFEGLVTDSLANGDGVRARYADIRLRLEDQINAFHSKIRALVG